MLKMAMLIIELCNIKLKDIKREILVLEIS